MKRITLNPFIWASILVLVLFSCGKSYKHMATGEANKKTPAADNTATYYTPPTPPKTPAQYQPQKENSSKSLAYKPDASGAGVPTGSTAPATTSPQNVTAERTWKNTNYQDPASKDANRHREIEDVKMADSDMPEPVLMDEEVEESIPVDGFVGNEGIEMNAQIESLRADKKTVQAQEKSIALARARAEQQKRLEVEKVRIRKVEEARIKKDAEKKQMMLTTQPSEGSPDGLGSEEYAHIEENDFRSAINEPLSTFSIDVDAASYANTRRFLNSNTMPQPGAVRIEEMVNYFNYTYRQPIGDQPFAINTEVSSCPWKPEHQLVHIGLKGKEIDRSELAASNLVFLLDVSGSMNQPSKLPLLKASFKMLLNNLNDQDRVAMVVYAGAAGVVLPSTLASDRHKILAALERLSAGGSTAGGQGIQLAYNVAAQNFIKNGNNRVILATDGDFNVGASSESELIKMIEERREEGVFLSVLGFGTGNYKDSRMELLADKGNGNYAYIDNILEAKKVLVNEMGGTLYAIAKDVKIQVEFNPTYVKGYRLIGYENRALANQDFNDDTKDAGELGAGHTVTALYEVVPVGSSTEIAGTDELKYQRVFPSNPAANTELMTVKFRYKKPDENVSKKIEHVVTKGETSLSATSENFRFSAAVASFGMMLRGSKYRGNSSYQQIIEMARGSLGQDLHSYRLEFVQLVEKARILDNRGVATGR